MARSLFILFVLLLALIANGSSTHIELLVHFEKDRSELTPKAITQLDSFLLQCTLNGEHAFTVHGHTDTDGSLAYNDALAAARSKVVMEYLRDHGVADEVVQVDNSGERHPLRRAGDDGSMAINRRVRITFTRNYYADTEELRQALTAGTVQHFTVDAGTEAYINGAAGVRLHIAANSLVDAQGRPAHGPVTVELTEAVSSRAMIGHNLSTRSGDRLLETGGMLKVTATDASGTELRLAVASPMEVMVPNGRIEEGMELFTSATGADGTSTSRPLRTTIRSWTEPARPAFIAHAFHAPVYREDRKGVPVKPSLPGLRSLPLVPRKESYPPRRTLLSFLQPKRAQAEADARFADAMAKHQVRVERHAKARVAYEQEMALYPERLQRYQERKAMWDERKKEEYAQWVDNVYLPAYQEYSRSRVGVQAQRDSLMALWNEQRDASLEEFVIKSDSAGTGDVGALNAYVFNASQLGWINCDRFYDVPAKEMVQVIAQGRAPANSEGFLIFTDMASILRMERISGGTWISPRVDRNQPAVLFAYTVIDGRPHVCNQRIVPGERPQVKFEPTTFSAISALLAGFGVGAG